MLPRPVAVIGLALGAELAVLRRLTPSLTLRDASQVRGGQRLRIGVE